MPAGWAVFRHIQHRYVRHVLLQPALDRVAYRIWGLADFNASHFHLCPTTCIYTLRNDNEIKKSLRIDLRREFSDVRVSLFVLSDGERGADEQLPLPAQWAPAQPLPHQPGERAEWQRDPVSWRGPRRLHASHLGAGTRRPRRSFLPAGY